MADIKLFSIEKNVTELEATSVTLEKELQNLIEQNMPAFFGVSFLESEYKITNGRIDSLGLDENNSPVIFEYKRSTNENVINQGLFYLDWLLDHKADFKLLVMDKLGTETSNNIDWSVPCVICIANDFTKYDEHAVNQMQRNIKLVRYKKFGDGLILFEHLNVPKVNPLTDTGEIGVVTSKSVSNDKTFLMQYAAAPKAMQNTYDSIKNYILSLGDDIIENQLKLYVAFKKVKNFKCEKAQEKFPEGNSHHTLLQGRLKAMYISKELITDKLAEISSAPKIVELKNEECSPEVLLSHLNLLHTTDLGAARIKKNLALHTDDIIAWCKDQIKAVNAVIIRRGKNWYVAVGGAEITVNAHSYTVITAHLK